MNTQQVIVQFRNDVKWDNWGRLVTAFKMHDVVIAEENDDGSYSAESPYWPGITDFIYPKDFHILGKQEEFQGK